MDQKERRIILAEQTGYLSVSVTTFDTSSPLRGAEVMISAVSDGVDTVLYRLVTDASGQTGATALPAPDVSSSLEPGSEGADSYVYRVTVVLDGYYTLVSPGVPVFSGVTSDQAMVMIPLTASCSVGSERRTPSCVYTADAPAVSGKGVYRG